MDKHTTKDIASSRGSFAAIAAGLLGFLCVSRAVAADRIVFEQDGAICTVNADGAGLRKLDIAGADSGPVRPVWSPDGRLIAFGTTVPGARSDDRSRSLAVHVWTLNVDSTRPVRIAEQVIADSGRDWEIKDIEWSRDSKRISCEAGTVLEETGHPGNECFVVNSDGRGAVSQGLTAYTDSFQPSRRTFEGLAPDGKHTLTTRAVNHTDELFVANPDMSGLRQITHTAALHDSIVDDEWGRGLISGAWSPDGKHIVFIPLMEGADYAWGGLFAVNADGTGQKRLGHDEYLLGELPKTWSPDGKRLVYEDHGAIYVTDFSAPPTKIADGHAPDWQP